jgi:hypothetical protein
MGEEGKLTVQERAQAKSWTIEMKDGRKGENWEERDDI